MPWFGLLRARRYCDPMSKESQASLKCVSKVTSVTDGILDEDTKDILK